MKAIRLPHASAHVQSDTCHVQSVAHLHGMIPTADSSPEGKKVKQTIIGEEPPGTIDYAFLMQHLLEICKVDVQI